MERILTPTKLILLLMLTFLITGCQHQKNNNSAQPISTVVATLKSIPTELYYGGTVSPIQYFNVISPSDGVIKSLNFKYGQRVKENDLLLIITSTKLQEDFHTALTDFIKAKSNYLNAQINFRGTQELKKANIISDQEYLSEKDQYQDAVLGYITAKNTLEKAVNKIPEINTKQLEALSGSDFAKIESILATRSSDLQIIAQKSGVVLLPQKGSTDSDNSGSKTLLVGNQVKEAQTLVTLGDLSGIETTVPVSELVVNQIKTGQKVKVSLEALPNITLQGIVKSVGGQAQTAGAGDQGGVANFPVIIDVAKINPQQAELIRVGMTTKVAITIQNPPQIMIPITAVNQQAGVSTVTVLDPAGNPKSVPVTTGQTTLDQVAIIQGLKPGDRVVVP